MSDPEELFDRLMVKSLQDSLDVRTKECDALKIENAMLHERCRPSKVVMIGDTGHYVSLGVHSYIEGLKMGYDALRSENAGLRLQRNDYAKAYNELKTLIYKGEI